MELWQRMSGGRAEDFISRYAQKFYARHVFYTGFRIQNRLRVFDRAGQSFGKPPQTRKKP